MTVFLMNTSNNKTTSNYHFLTRADVINLLEQKDMELKSKDVELKSKNVELKTLTIQKE